MQEKNIWMKIAYDGSGFSGWQRQQECRTVCGVLEEKLFNLLNFPVKLYGTSRTDAGVHALGQCASFKAPIEIPAQRLPRALNDRLAEDRLEGIGDIRILKAKEMPPEFHARFSSTGKRYIYKIYNSTEKDVFLRTRCYQVSRNLDINLMKKAAEILTGEQDFAAFMSMGSTVPDSTVRTIYRFTVEEQPFQDGKLITLTVEGNAFLYNMVRILTGTLVEVGTKKIPLSQVETALSQKKRNLAGHVAPPQGLYLAKVFYDKVYFPEEE